MWDPTGMGHPTKSVVSAKAALVREGGVVTVSIHSMNAEGSCIKERSLSLLECEFDAMMAEAGVKRSFLARLLDSRR